MLAGLCCLALIPMMGLAIDGTGVYMMRDRLTAGLQAAVAWPGNRKIFEYRD